MWRCDTKSQIVHYGRLNLIRTCHFGVQKSAVIRIDSSNDRPDLSSVSCHLAHSTRFSTKLRPSTGTTDNFLQIKLDGMYRKEIRINDSAA